jgi:thiamine-monophosphate kinase
MSITMSSYSEPEFINDIRSKYNLNFVGDDCAVLPKSVDTDIVVTADLLVEDVDFRLSWTDPYLLGRKALSVSLSDIAAMGGTPTWAMLSIAVPETLWNTGFLHRFYEGWHSRAREFGVTLIGGDTSRSPDKLVIDSIVSGDVSKGMALLRSGARPGDVVYVTGTLGGAAGGLKLLESGHTITRGMENSAQRLLLKHLDPSPQIVIAKYLLKHRLASSVIDVSDGFSTDIFHICEKSDVGCIIYADRLPIDAGLRDFSTAQEALALALGGGEDFELIFTIPPSKEHLLEIRDVTKVGEITDDKHGKKIVLDGETVDLLPSGFSHF